MSKRDNYLKTIEKFENDIKEINAEYNSKINSLKEQRNKKLSVINIKLKTVKEKLEAEDNKEKFSIVKNMTVEDLKNFEEFVKAQRTNKNNTIDVDETVDTEVSDNLSYERKEIDNEQV